MRATVIDPGRSLDTKKTLSLSSKNLWNTKNQDFLCGSEWVPQGQSGMEKAGTLFIPGMCPTGGWCSEGEAPA